MTLKDKYGNPLEVGARVAFNWSGEVCIGTLIAITPSKRYGKTEDWNGEPHYNFDVQHQNSRNTSRVRRVSSLAVI